MKIFIKYFYWSNNKKNKDTKLETLYQQVIRAIFHAETAGGWRIFTLKIKK